MLKEKVNSIVGVISAILFPICTLITCALLVLALNGVVGWLPVVLSLVVSIMNDIVVYKCTVP